jgi:hypothetical protein
MLCTLCSYIVMYDVLRIVLCAACAAVLRVLRELRVVWTAHQRNTQHATHHVCLL